MTLGELHAGVLLATDGRVRAARLARLGHVQREFAILDVDPHVAQAFGELRARSGRRAVADLLIAATALANDMLLVTRDEQQARLLGDQALLLI
jgi:predicted nucleic acid-binding protein